MLLWWDLLYKNGRMKRSVSGEVSAGISFPTDRLLSSAIDIDNLGRSRWIEPSQRNAGTGRGILPTAKLKEENSAAIENQILLANLISIFDRHVCLP